MYFGRNLKDLLDLALYDVDISSSEDSSDKVDYEFLFLEMFVNPKQQLGKHLNLDDISENHGETMFRLESLWCLSKQTLLLTNLHFI